ncbi:AAA family ATPase [Streptomyces microflavus]|uniref:AAA family ATPase n=1 Tax=Streptomyces microflavus TaxID=1919 RepID=UPI0036948A5F
MLPLTPPGGSLITLIGAPGSGKSTFAAHYPDSWRVCLDTYRRLATDSEADQTGTGVAAQIQDLLVDARLNRGLITLVDSTNLAVPVRAGLVARARYWQRPALAVLFDVPLDIAQTQNRARSRVVPEHVVRDLHQQLPTPELLETEGFAAVHRVSDLALPARS